MIKIYIAARTSQRDVVNNLNNRFRKVGFEVFDWTGHKNTKPYLQNREIATTLDK